ncbi:nucleotidyl transferase AbiEii/AbiGii toxin family protein [Cellulomonas sp. H30R-01]|uniref:nucleotidyl transferase AbiEii/AbiGii toxin family protein n=1 Tax=Cellulomonas sp. H30R-01 TaxID=2704467 RepID=UPI00138C0CF4|nr:nucleotidyl transferase AbiEii/AbiGii toxin family protein [Cellulomonas sp. H30R-01]QHT58186.1 nucleotidyl transferase AbiEii/AbiGii toxin family protein [Cellulomonas sp. H30R-01]
MTQTPYRDDFVLKGGVLLAAHGLRRPTRDIDAQLVDQTLDEVHLRAVVRAVAELPVDDALVGGVAAHVAAGGPHRGPARRPGRARRRVHRPGLHGRRRRRRDMGQRSVREARLDDCTGSGLTVATAATNLYP